ncbi:MAG: hypothetical protein NTU89_00675, partial [Candidatus Dependentiae bacterium]|nr:hypothetical protein [Candidatus Dependentiae bacterium]
MTVLKISAILFVIIQSTNIQTSLATQESNPRLFENCSMLSQVQADTLSDISNSSVGPQTLVSNQSIVSTESHFQKKQNIKNLTDLSTIKNIQVAQKTFRAFKKKYDPAAYLQTESGKNSEYSRYLQIMYNLAALESIQSIVFSYSAQVTKRQNRRVLAMKKKQTEIVTHLLAGLKS